MSADAFSFFLFKNFLKKFGTLRFDAKRRASNGDVFGAHTHIYIYIYTCIHVCTYICICVVACSLCLLCVTTCYVHEGQWLP